ncbi:hypothetical protein EIN_087650 [Entamoeba invadens IP1]|uniref:hypothetical protein n=1 Tax=Entamoeba invadens IP1 TaxID=370355 RepID=UPI0002C3CE90|nr:hypothetical protein EIN_087650 [Entamoeba invadens IP1]ELP85443.1 hypothetical protein EIN_087650 [Entamoeba invadens IP1]|eukprot:XP_004184789.1 hypothetical protein EIN_087650 [Entamoeba invadens IP1]
MLSKKILKNRESRDIYIDYQCVLMVLLTSDTSFLISKPQKWSITSKSFIKIRTLTIYEKHSGEIWEFPLQKFIKDRSQQKVFDLLKEGYSKKTATRRVTYERMREGIHYLEDMLLFKGFKMENDGENRFGFTGNVKITFPDGRVMTEKNIRTVGNIIWEYFRDKLNKKQEYVIDKNELIKLQGDLLAIVL